MSQQSDQPSAEGVNVSEVHRWCRRLASQGVPMSNRSDIKLAAYNPRSMDLNAKIKLKQGLREFGLVEPLIGNRATGTLVGGHQRVACMDEEIGRSHSYSIPVIWLDLSPTREKELNVLLNNPGAQGWWDHQKMAEMIAEDKDINVELMGFDKVMLKADLTSFADLGNLDLSHVFGDEKIDDAADDVATINAMKATKEEHKSLANEFSADGFYVMLVFQNEGQKAKFCEAAEISPNAKNADGIAVCKRLDIDIGVQDIPDPDMGNSLGDPI